MLQNRVRQRIMAQKCGDEVPKEEMGSARGNSTTTTTRLFIEPTALPGEGSAVD